MALLKPIKLENGITVTYHRVTHVLNVTNQEITIGINSYIDQEGRESEQQAYAMNERQMAYVEGLSVILPYREEFGIVDAYEYLKTLPEFEGAQDVWDESDA